MDYVSAGILSSLYAISNKQQYHSYVISQVAEIFNGYFDQTFSRQIVERALNQLARRKIIRLIRDPYAESLVEVSDKELIDYFESLADGDEVVLTRAWSADKSWVTSVYNNPAFTSDLMEVSDNGPDDVVEIPASDRMVLLDDNSKMAEVIEAVANADEVVRASNVIPEVDRDWIRSHLESGRLLLTKGGRVSVEALKSLLIEPLKAALKLIVEEHGKAMLQKALHFVISLFQ